MLSRIFTISCIVFSIAASQAEDSYIESDGVKIHFTVEGKGQEVVLLHGFMANAELNWRLPGITPALAESYRVIAIDVRGHGQSGKPHERESYGVDVVKDVVRVLDHLSIAKAHVVGYSMGGFITMKLAAEHPARVISTTLGGSGGIRDDYDHTWDDKLAEKLEAGESLEDAMKSVLPPDVEMKEDHLAILRAILYNNQDTKALAANLRGWRDLSVSYQKLAANKIPTLFIYGNEEAAELQTYITSLEGRMSNAQFQPIDGTNHFTTVSSPRFREAILKFIKANSGR
jgi:pimeloyl-ACP methyl ester carboxylesterase